MDAENKWTDAGQLGRELERVKTECVELRRQNERLREALLTIHRVLTKDGVCFHCDAGDDVICAEAFDSVKQALAAQPEEKTK